MASERGSAQTSGACSTGVVGPSTWKSKTGLLVELLLESQTIEGDSPVGENDPASAGLLSTTGHANPVGNWEAHFPRLNTLDDR